MEPEKNHPTKKERRQQRQREKQQERLHRKRRRYARRVLLWLSVAVGIIVLVLGMVKLTSRPTDTTGTLEPATLSIHELDWVKGNPDTGVALIEYSDFQCPACAAYHPILAQLVADLGDRMVLAYRHFPLKHVHPNAESAARAAEASGRQGKFWEMHDLIFRGQAKWANERDPEETFIEYASELGLDLERFREDLGSRSVSAAVDEDTKSGMDAGVDGTPTFYLNGIKIRNPRSYGEFRALIMRHSDEDF